MKKWTAWQLFREEFSHSAGCYSYCDSYEGYELIRRSPKVRRIPFAFMKACVYMVAKATRSEPDLSMSLSRLQTELQHRLASSAHLKRT